MPFRLEPKFQNSLGEPEYSAETMACIQEYYEDIREEFLDEVFDYECKLPRADWERLTA